MAQHLIFSFDPETKEGRRWFTLDTVTAWGYTPFSFTFNFVGVNYEVETKEGRRIESLIK